MSDQLDLDHHQHARRSRAVGGRERVSALRPAVTLPLGPDGPLALASVCFAGIAAPARLFGLALPLLSHLREAFNRSASALPSRSTVLLGSLASCHLERPPALDDYSCRPFLSSEQGCAIPEKRFGVGAHVGSHLTTVDLPFTVSLAFDLLSLTFVRKHGYDDTCGGQRRHQAGSGEDDGACSEHESDLSHIGATENAGGHKGALHPDPSQAIAQSVTLTYRGLPFLQSPAFGVRQALSDLLLILEPDLKGVERYQQVVIPVWC